MTVFELEHREFIGDGNYDHLIKWVKAEPDDLKLIEAIAHNRHGAVQLLPHCEDGDGIDFSWPADRDAIDAWYKAPALKLFFVPVYGTETCTFARSIMIAANTQADAAGRVEQWINGDAELEILDSSGDRMFQVEDCEYTSVDESRDITQVID